MEDGDAFKAEREVIIFNEKKDIAWSKGNGGLKIAGNWNDEKKVGFVIKFKNFQIGIGIRLRESINLLFGFQRRGNGLPD